jgi:hypothetical protein
MRAVRAFVVLLALSSGLFMSFDGLRALFVGDYLTPNTGAHAGQLGPWSRVVQAVGIEPRSTPMKVTFVGLGLAWLTAMGGFVRRAPWNARALTIVAVATLWYLPVGTVTSALVLIGLAVLRKQAGGPA